MADYNDFWFIDTRVQTTNLKRWFLWGIILFVFVGVGTYLCVKSFYHPLDNYYIFEDNVPTVTVEESMNTNANGYVKGTVINETDTEIKGKYIKFTFYTKKDIDIGSEYVEIGNLAPHETKTYEAKYKYPNVERFTVTISDNKE